MKFIQDITFGQYVRGRSLIHNFDPRVKLVAVSVYLPIIFTSRGTLRLSLIALVAFLSINLSGISIKFIFKSLRHFFWLFLFAGIFHFFFTPGMPVPYLTPITYEGLEAGGQVIIQLILAILFSNLLILTTPPLEITMGMERLFHPLKRVGVPVSDLSMMMLVAIRFIPILKTETEGIIKAQRCRGINFSRGSLVERAKNIPAVLVPLIYNSFRRADELAIAMVSRGYVPGAERGSMKEMSLKFRDYAAMFFSMAVIGVCAISNR